jgi:hypothetical protein
MDRETVLTRQFPLLEAARSGEDLKLALETGDLATLEETKDTDEAL